MLKLLVMNESLLVLCHSLAGSELGTGTAHEERGQYDRFTDIYELIITIKYRIQFKGLVITYRALYQRSTTVLCHQWVCKVLRSRIKLNKDLGCGS